MALSDIVNRIGRWTEDVVSLDVVTLTGSISISTATGDDGINLAKLYEEIGNKAKVEGNLEVVAFTHIDLDKDAINYVKSGLSEAEQPMIEAHNAMVDTAQKARQAFLMLAKELVGVR